MIWQISNALIYNLTYAFNELRSKVECSLSKKRRTFNDLFSHVKYKPNMSLRYCFSLMVRKKTHVTTDYLHSNNDRMENQLNINEF